MEIKIYENQYRDEIIALVLHCQNDGTRPLVTVNDQPELLDIQSSYFAGGGYFWIAVEQGRLAGTIGLMNYDHGVGIVKKFFVYEQYRSSPTHLGQQLYAQLLDYAKNHGFKVLILDTPNNAYRAQNFYTKAGFSRITKEHLPVQYDYPYEDSYFYQLMLS